jgi:hypothetical protein
MTTTPIKIKLDTTSPGYGSGTPMIYCTIQSSANSSPSFFTTYSQFSDNKVESSITHSLSCSVRPQSSNVAVQCSIPFYTNNSQNDLTLTLGTYSAATPFYLGGTPAKYDSCTLKTSSLSSSSSSSK